MRARRLAESAAATICVVALAPALRAATSLHTSVSARQAEVGEGIRIEVSALSSDDDAPGSPHLDVPAGFNVQGPSVSSSRQISFSNGHFESRHGITATWLVVGTRPGQFTIGPATILVGTNRVRGETVQVEIVPVGSLKRAPKPRRRGLFDPFDPFSMFPNLPSLNDDEDDSAVAPPDAPADFQVDQAPDPIAFLRTKVVPESVVVGQQLNLKVYAYGSRGPYEEISSSGLTRPDFVTQVISEDSRREPRHIVAIGDDRWLTVKVREYALFPLKAGMLTIGAMKMGIRGPGYPNGQTLAGLELQTKEIQVAVHEPPLAGRPPGYELGDVGSYTLSAEVAPRRVEAGGAIGVTIRIEGVGNVPGHVKLPAAKGVEWLDPEKQEEIRQNNGVISGFRQFRYVVRLQEPGHVDLGEVTLPYFDPATSSYHVARAGLGKVEVDKGASSTTLTPAASAAPNASNAVPVFELPPPRKALGPVSPDPTPLVDSRWYWPLTLGGPVGALALAALVRALRRARNRLRQRGESQGAVARRAMSEANAGAGRGDARAVASAAERAVYATLEDRFDLRGRGILRERLGSELEARGVPSDLAKETVELLDSCDALRFATAVDPKEVAKRTGTVVSRLGRVSVRRTEVA